MLGRTLSLLLPLTVVVAGCATWQKKSEQRSPLPPPQVPLDAIVCELAYVQWEPRPVEKDQRFWHGVDEQFIPAEVRQRLAENGLRIGLISGTLPAELRDKLTATADPVAALTAEEMPRGVEMLSRREKRQCRLGISELVEVLPERPGPGVVLWREESGVRGAEFDRPRGFFLLTPHSHDDGRLRLELVPGIDYGEARQRMIGNPGIWRIDVRRERKLFELLGVDVLVHPGQTLVLTATPESKGIGSTFFANRFASATDQLFLLIRVGGALRDNLFVAPDDLQPLVTPLE
jgi:hypothetical protein